MKLKSLLLGSAAALVAVSGARAADAIVVEPEPMEYVKVCDMYGAGYFYIPGTETCLSIRGNVRVQYSSDHYHDDDSVSYHDVTVRARVYFTAKNETEYGTLGSDILFQGTASDDDYHDDFSSVEGQDNSMSLVKATINLAGFRTGYDADGGAAWNRYAGYGYYNARSDGAYSFHSALFFEYGQSAGDFNWVVGIQDTPSSGSSGQPDLYAAMGYAAGGLSLGAAVVYDSNASAMAYRVRADYDLNSFLPGGSIGAWMENDNNDTDYVKGHKWGVTAKGNLTDKMVWFAGYSAYNSSTAADFRDWTAGVRWNVASNLSVQGEWNKRLPENASTRGRMTLRIVRSF